MPRILLPAPGSRLPVLRTLHSTLLPHSRWLACSLVPFLRRPNRERSLSANNKTELKRDEKRPCRRNQKAGKRKSVIPIHSSKPFPLILIQPSAVYHPSPTRSPFLPSSLSISRVPCRVEIS